RERVDQVKGMLPQTAGAPNVLRFDPQQIPVIWVGLTGENAKDLQTIADKQVVPYFQRQEGGGSVTVEGGITEEVQVILHREKLVQYGLNAGMRMQAIGASNQSASAGMIDKGDQNLQIRITGEYESIADIENTIIQTPTGGMLHLKDIGTVELTEKERTSLSYVNGKPSV